MDTCHCGGECLNGREVTPVYIVHSGVSGRLEPGVERRDVTPTMGS